MPTTDPSDFMNGGALLPIGEHKGYGLTLLGEILAGALSGAAMISEIGSNRTPDRPTDTGHAVIAIEPASLMPRFDERVAHMASLVKGAPRAEHGAEILIPGELEHREEERTRAAGLALDRMIWHELTTLAGQLGVSAELERTRR